MTTYPLRVARRRLETEDTVSLWFTVPRDLTTALSYRTGQFLSVEEEIAGRSVTRQYSLASVPELDDELQVIVKRIPEGLMSTWLVDEVDAGDILEVEAPRGRFYVPSTEPRHHLLLAAGSGIVPLYAIARHAAHLGVGHEVTLAYGNRHASSVIMRPEVDALTELGVRVEHVISRPPDGWAGAVGHVDAAYLESRWDELTASGLPLSVYLCGPEDFMAGAESFLLHQGIDLNDIRTESFDLVLHDDSDEPDILVPESVAEPVDGSDGQPEEEAEDCYLITAVVDGQEIEVVPEAGEPLLTSLLRVSEDVPFSCQEGTCSSCIVRLVEGRVGVRPQVLATLRPDDLADGLVLACLSRARTESVRIDFDDI